MYFGDKPTVKEVATTVQQHGESLETLKASFQLLDSRLTQAEADRVLATSRMDYNFSCLFKLFGIDPPPPPPDQVHHNESQNESGESSNGFRDLIGGAVHREQGKFSRHPKVDFPHFDGTNPRGWVLKCERYFYLHQLPESERVDMATIHFTSKVDP